ncbi:hypothetical protein [uncultured Algimonas sp.]|uniref:TonB-dependent receptor plug domain-containing protein n=1 Tax=uncultured Algimonas sp. TaxID=1547920 RepID=UPI0026315E26|nr:hypothetical protein [uncultured Algimonas sp.]
MSIFNRPLLAATGSPCLISGLFAGLIVSQAVSVTAAAQTVDTLQADARTTEGGTGQTVPPAPADNAYPADYFALYVPRTALDMVRRIPGFQITRGDTGRRGLGQGGANILINGERLTGKTDPFDQLSQIQAESVVEIRIRDGATLSIPGLSGQVADVTVERTRALKGTWEWNPQFRRRLEPNLTNGELTLSGELGEAGGLTYALTLRDYGFRSGARATETLRNADGVLFETRDEDFQNGAPQPGAALNLGWTPRPDHKANLNAEYWQFNFSRSARAVRTPVTSAGDDTLTFSGRGEDEWNLEMDADYEFPVLSGTLKFIGVLDRESSPTFNSFSRTSPRTGFLGASRFDQEAEETEVIGRAEYGWSPSEGRDWQIAAEGAFNELDVEQQLFLRRPGGVLEGQGLSAFNVSEDRAEASLTHSRPLGPRLDLQASAGVEYSSLSQSRLTGPQTEAREFVRPKGFVSSTYKVDDSFDIRARLEREVGQLNFFDFVAAVDLEDNLNRTSNFDLVPSQSWLGSVEFDKDFGDGNTFRIEFYGAVISDTVDRIPVGTDGDAVGNIGKAHRYGFDIVSTIKGDRWGLPGTELNIEFDWRDSSVDDPLLGFPRRLNGDKEIAYDVEYRHDVTGTDWAYGGSVSRFISAERFRLFSIDRNGVDGPNSSLFVEHKDVAGLTLRATLFNVLGNEEFFERTRFDGRRDAGIVRQTEEIKYNFGPILSLSVEGSF